MMKVFIKESINTKEFSKRKNFLSSIRNRIMSMYKLKRWICNSVDFCSCYGTFIHIESFITKFYT